MCIPAVPCNALAARPVRPQPLEHLLGAGQAGFSADLISGVGVGVAGAACQTVILVDEAVTGCADDVALLPDGQVDDLQSRDTAFGPHLKNIVRVNVDV